MSREGEQREKDCHHSPGVRWRRQELVSKPNQIIKVCERVPYEDTEEGGSENVADQITHRRASFQGG